MFKAAKTWSFFKSWLDGMQFVSIRLFFGNFAFKYKSRKIYYAISEIILISSLGLESLETTCINKEI